MYLKSTKRLAKNEEKGSKTVMAEVKRVGFDMVPQSVWIDEAKAAFKADLMKIWDKPLIDDLNRADMP